MDEEHNKSKKSEVREFKINIDNKDLCYKAFLILKHTHESCKALLSAYRIARVVRGILKSPEGKELKGSVRGMSTDEEQDLLRAMLVTSASGLDSMIKQLIRDTLPKLITKQKKALEGLEIFIERSIKGDVDEENFKGSKFLANILAAKSIQDQIIEKYIDTLTKGSLQSIDELHKATGALALSLDDLKINQDYKKSLTDIFDVRNKIIHELDINFEAINRNRNHRNELLMKQYTNTLLELAENILTGVDNRLKYKRRRTLIR